MFGQPPTIVSINLKSLSITSQKNINKLIIVMKITYAFTIFFLFNELSSFKIISRTQDKEVYYPGQTMDLVCSSDTHWEFCIWTQKESSDASNTCHLEWKRAKVRGNIP